MIGDLARSSQARYEQQPTMGDLLELQAISQAPNDARVSVKRENPDPPYAAAGWTVELHW